MTRVEELLTSTNARNLLAQHRESRKGKITIQLERLARGETRAYILSEDMASLSALEAKMLQFPRGTVFTLEIDGPDNIDPARKALQAWGKEHAVAIGN
jgi:hypothetical protein